MIRTQRAGLGQISGRSGITNRHKLLSIIVLAGVAATLILQTGCIGITGATSGTGPTSAAAMISASPSSLNFGSIPIGSSGTQNMIISNPGTATLTISQETIAGTGFSILSGSTSISIAPGKSQSISIKYTPSTTGNSTGSVALSSNVVGSPLNVPLSGTGLAAASAAIIATPSIINYGSVVIGGSGASQAITITNDGTANLTITQAIVAGSGFTINGLTLPLTLVPGASATFYEVFSPTSTSTVSGTTSLVNNSPTSPYVITSSGTGAQGLLSASPSPVNFGNVAVGSNSSLTVTLTNSGSGSTTVSQISASGSGFSFSGIQLPFTLGAGLSTTFTAKFSPIVPGATSGNLTFVSTSPNSPAAITLTGTGTQAGISSNPTSMNFGSVSVGSPSSQTIQLSNTGTSSLTITQANATGTGFSVSGLTLPTTIPAGSSTSFTATFGPSSTGASTGSISIVSNAPNSPLAIPLSGTGAQAGISSNPSSVNFGSILVGSPSSRTIQLSNTGTSSLTITQANATGTGFSMSGLTLPATIPAGGSTTFSATFVPTSTSAVTGSISIVSNAPNSPLAIPLSGTGAQAGISATPSSANFGNVIAGSPNSQTIQLSNTGTSSLTISQANISGTGFSLSGLALPTTIPAGGNTTFNVAFGPVSSGSASGSLSIVSNAPNSPLAIPLSGTGIVNTFLLGASTSNLSFGNVAIGSNNSQNVTLTNNGNSTITVSSFSITGTGFSSTGVIVGQSIGAGQTATLNVTFTPASAATVNGNVAISSNATNSPITISLSGTGTPAPVAHSVTLTWTPSTSSVVGYNVYRSTVSGGPYTLLTSSPVAGTTFTDTTVQAGLTYFYVVTAVDASSNESVFSNEASANVPTP